MTNDTRSPEEIERDIERERAGLTDTLDSLQSKFSIESMARQVSDQFQKHGGDIGQSITDAVKRNPIGLALTGIGLAWLMMGDRTVQAAPYGDRYRDDRIGSGVRDYDRDDDASRSGSRVDTGRSGSRSYRAYEPSGGSSSSGSYAGSSGSGGSSYGSGSSGSGSSYPGRSSYSGGSSYSGASRSQDNLPSWARDDRGQSDQRGMGAKVGDAMSGARDAMGNAADSVSDAASNAVSSVSDATSGASDRARGLAQSASDTVQDYASSAVSRAQALYDRLSEGTENLSDEARQRVMAARERALDMRDAAMDYTRQGATRARDLIEEQPLIGAAIALAVGAAVGAALPRSRMEDEYFGERSDELFHEAERIYEEEKQKLVAVAGAATDEARNIANEVRTNAENAAPGGSVSQAIVDKARSSAERIADAARSEADKQNLGDVKKS